MVDKVPKDITPGTANRGSLIHASDADTAGILSRAHLEEDISRVQSAALAFSAAVAYKVGDFVVEATVLYRAALANGPGAFTASDWVAISEVQTRTNTTLAADQLINTIGDNDITGLTVTLPTASGKHAIIAFNINYLSGENDKDLVFKVSDNAVITNEFSQFGGKAGDLQGITYTYVATLAGQIVKAVVALDGGADPISDITIQGLTAGRRSSMQTLEID